MLINIFQNYSMPTALIVFLGYIIAVLLTLSLHNFFQAFVSYKQGDMTAKAYGMLSLNPFRHVSALGLICLIIVGFGWSKPVPMNPFQFREGRKGAIKVALSGMIGNLIVSIIFSFLYVLTLLIDGTSSFAIFIQGFCYYMTIINFIFFVFNLLPIYPLDCFIFLSLLLSSENKFLLFMFKWGFIILLVLLLTGIFSLLVQTMLSLILSPLFHLWQIILF